MQGINPLTGSCTYKTPCGWCAKWDKKCDKKIPEPPVINQYDYLTGTPINKICQSEEDHQWECYGIGTAGTTYICKICGKYKTEPVWNQESTTISVDLNNQSLRTCAECDKEGWDMPQCKECNAANNFKYFKRKKDTK